MSAIEQCLGCLPGRNGEGGERYRDDDLGGRSGVQREMTVVHNQQPHLVPPMKLVFYDDMPSTPNAPDRSSTRMSEWPSMIGGSSRPSSVRSRTVLRKRRTTTMSRRDPLRTISPVQRIPAFRPLQLSIYLPNNRLSDLPEFDLAEFNSMGEITLPPKALTRAKSEANLPPVISDTSPRKAQSMVDWRPRPTAEGADPIPRMPGYPIQRQSITWNSLPGISAPEKPTMSGALMRPITPPPSMPTTLQQDSMRLTFPPVDREDSKVPDTTTIRSRPSADDFPRPPAAITPPRSAVTAPSSSGQPTPNTRVSQWLERSNTSSTTSSTSTTPRRGRKSPPSKLSISPPIPIQPPEHIRTTTISSITSAQGALSHVASVHLSHLQHERTTTMSSLTPSNAPSQRGSKHSRNRTTSSSTIASTALSSLLNNADAVSLSSYTTLTASPPATSIRGPKSLMPALPIRPGTAPNTSMTEAIPAPPAAVATIPLATIKDDSVVTILPISDSADIANEVDPKPNVAMTDSSLALDSNRAQEQERTLSPASSASSDSHSGPITPPRQRMLAQQAANPSFHRSKGSSGSHWGYLPKQYAEVWKRETVVSEKDVGVAF